MVVGDEIDELGEVAVLGENVLDHAVGGIERLSPGRFGEIHNKHVARLLLREIPLHGPPVFFDVTRGNLGVGFITEPVGGIELVHQIPHLVVGRIDVVLIDTLVVDQNDIELDRRCQFVSSCWYRNDESSTTHVGGNSKREHKKG